MAKAKSGGGNTKISFTNQKKGKTTIGGSASSIKFSTMNKRKRANYKAYRGQGR
mgnify:CR=1 FL=1|jgi:hypothetical protein